MLRDEVLEIIKQLPEDANLEEILKAIYIKLRVDEGINQFKNGKTTTLEDLKKEIAEW